MIPTVLLAGFVAGVAVRSWWSTPVIAIAWGLVILATMDGPVLQAAAGGTAIALPNAAVGVAVGRGLRAGIEALWSAAGR